MKMPFPISTQSSQHNNNTECVTAAHSQSIAIRNTDEVTYSADSAGINDIDSVVYSRFDAIL